MFMDDFLVMGDSFDYSFAYLAIVLRRSKECNLVLNWEKCQSMVKEGIVLSHKILKKIIDVNNPKLEVHD